MTATKKPYSIDACRICGTTPKVGAIGGICTKCMLAAGMASERDAMLNRSREMQSTDFSKPGSRPFSPPTPEELKNEFPNLEILEVAGIGGMGVVYKVKHNDLGRVFALKILPREFASDPTFVARFSQEVKTLALLSHPNIVHIYDAGQTENYSYLTMEYVDGINLRQAIRAGNMKPEEALSIVPQICKALQFAHSEGVVHRDIKPENILIDKDGVVKVADFGLAKLVDADLGLTATQQVMGTVHYMAPEQIKQSSNVDHRADLYSLGVVFYEMLTGQLPLGKFAMPSTATSVHPDVDSVVMRTLENQPDQRYQTASEIRDELASVESFEVPAPRKLGSEEALMKQMKSWLHVPGILLLTASAIGIIWLLGAFFEVSHRGDQWWLAFFALGVGLFFSGITFVAGWRMLYGQPVGLLRVLAAIVCLKTLYFSAGILLRIIIAAPSIGFSGLFRLGLFDLGLVGALIGSVVALIRLFSGPASELRQVQAMKQDAEILGSFKVFSSSDQTKVVKQLWLPSTLMFFVGVAGVIYTLAMIAVFNANGTSAYAQFSALGLMGVPLCVLMVVSSVLLRYKKWIGFNRFVAWFALMPFGPIYPLFLLTGIWTLVVLGRMPVRRLFLQNETQRREAVQRGV